VTATVNSHNPAANGSSIVESALRRTTASPPGTQVSDDVLIARLCEAGMPATANVARSMNVDAATAHRRRRSTFTGRKDANTISAGSIAIAANQIRRSFIAITLDVETERQS